MTATLHRPGHTNSHLNSHIQVSIVGQMSRD